MGGSIVALPQERTETVALDSGAIIALARGDVKAAAIVQRMRRAGAPIIIPAPVLAEVLRGTPRDAPVHRVLRIFDAERPMSPAAARHAGSLLGATRSHPARTLDALIVATALEHGATTILTQDERDIAALAPPRLAVLSI